MFHPKVYIKTYLSLCICLAAVLFHQAAFAASGGSDKGGIGWIGVGGGTTAMQTPVDKVTINTLAHFVGGFDTKPWGPFYFTIGLALNGYKGDLDYKYLGTDNVQYNVDDLDFTSANEEYFLGLGIRIINTKHFKYFLGGGGVAGSADYKFDAATNATLIGQGSFFETEQRSVNYCGYYGISGFDILFGQFGIRLGGRFSEVRTERIHVLDKKHLRYQDSMGFFAIIKEL